MTHNSDWMCINHGVRQGCVASPHLFALHIDMVMRVIDEFDGYKIWDEVVNNLRYADDTVMVAETEELLQQWINMMVTESEIKCL